LQTQATTNRDPETPRARAARETSTFDAFERAVEAFEHQQQDAAVFTALFIDLGDNLLRTMVARGDSVGADRVRQLVTRCNAAA
jgi:hypothetical protein